MFDEAKYNNKMQKTYEVFNQELGSLRTGRANANMLDIVKVDVYGQQMPINQLGSITTPEPRTINIQVWDLSNVNLIDSAIKKSELGLNPQIDGQLIRLPIPELNEELKKLLKSKEISEDDEKTFEKNVQNITDKHIQLVDEKVSSKEKEIMTI